MSASAIPVYTGPVYPGLRPFRPDENILFFGREQQTDELLRRLQDTRFLAVVGLSGTGKSSLVQAGLIPSLERGNLAASGSLWRFATMKPGLDPLASAVQALNKTLGESPARTATLRSSRLGLLEASCIGRQPNENLLFVVDQFEELFRFQRNQAERSNEAQEFVALLLAAAREYSADFPIYIVLTMRSDYLGECARFPGLVQALNEGQYLTEPMSRSQLHDVIVGPAGLAGVTIEPELIEYLLDTAVGQQDQLPVLQHSLMRLWSIREGQTLTLAEYNGPRVGGWERALDIHANDVFFDIPPSLDNGDVFQKIFQRLTEKGEENRENRRPTKLSELAAVANCTLDQARDLVEYFRADQCSFLTSQDSQLTAESVIDITHESLIRRWQALKDWAKQEAEWGDWYQRVEDRLRINGELSASELDVVAKVRAQGQWNEAWAERYRTEKNGIKPTYGEVIQYLDASQKKLLLQRKRRKQLTVLAVVLALFFAALAAATGYFWWSAKQAQTKAQAQLSQNDWQFSRDERNAGRQLESLEWAAEAVSLDRNRMLHDAILQDIRTGLPVAWLSSAVEVGVAIDGAKFSRDENRILTWGGGGAAIWDIRTAQLAGPVFLQEQIQGARFSKDQSRILTWGKDSTVKLWDARTGNQIGTTFHHNPTNGGMRGAAFTKDESRILSWAYDQTVRLWDVPTGNQIEIWRGAQNAIFTKDESRILTFGRDGTARLWDLRSHIQLGATLSHGPSTFGVRGAAFTKDQSRILTWGGNTARIWDARTGSQIGPTLKHEGDVNGAVFSKDEHRILTWSDDGTARFWDARTGRQIGPALKHDGVVFGATFSKDETEILTWSNDNTARIWDSKSCQQIGPSLKHDSLVGGATFSEDQNRVLTWSWDKTARLWNAHSGSQIGTPLYHAGTVSGAAFTKNGRDILTWGLDGAARLWEVPVALPIQPRTNHDDSVTGALCSPDASRFITWSGGNTARLWDVKTGTQIGPSLQLDGGPITGAVFSKDTSRILTWSPTGKTARMWDGRNGNPIGLPFKGEGGISGAVFSEDGNLIMIRSDKTARVWNSTTGEPIGPPLHLDGGFSGAALSKDGRRILTWSVSGMAQLWDGRTGSEIGPPLGQANAVLGGLFSKDEQRILTWGLDNTARLWDVRTGKQIGPSLQHDPSFAGVLGAMFSSDESRILTWGFDHTAKLWDASSGTQVGPTFGHATLAAWFGALLSKDNSKILTWSDDKTARLWDARTGNQIGPALRHEGPVIGASFTKDDSHILTWSADHTARLWDISADLDFPADQFKTLVQALTGVELDVNSQQLKTIEPARWLTIRDQYNRIASAHALVCKYPTANQWLLFHPVPSTSGK